MPIILVMVDMRMIAILLLVLGPLAKALWLSIDYRYSIDIVSIDYNRDVGPCPGTNEHPRRDQELRIRQKSLFSIDQLGQRVSVAAPRYMLGAWALAEVLTQAASSLLIKNINHMRHRSQIV